MKLHDVQEAAADLTYILGLIIKYMAKAALFIMAAIGTVSIDIVLLAYAEKHHNQFLTGFIWGSFFQKSAPLELLFTAPFISAIAVCLSFFLGVPLVGIGILLGWVAATTLFMLGIALEALSEHIRPQPVMNPNSFFENPTENGQFPPQFPQPMSGNYAT